MESCLAMRLGSVLLANTQHNVCNCKSPMGLDKYNSGPDAEKEEEEEEEIKVSVCHFPAALSGRS